MSNTGKNRQFSALRDDPLWYKDAIIYELHVRSFYDSDGNGVGDFAGLKAKLDYLVDLGVNTLWLLPFYPSPLKDDGYDISDYFNVHSIYGTLADFQVLIKEAHRRGLRIITELVINHTSDQHAWFQRARQASPGSTWRNFYVWNDTAEKYKEARIIFKDYEYSNWTWDHLAQAYYWHRFYSHQPDLNYDTPAVSKAIFKVLDFWLKQGVDGLRVDAVPYLYEREGTSCENLPETHALLKKLRAHVDENFTNRMLLAEANQWPEDVAPYFGDGDEFHMSFHFPIMPRLFMAIGMEDRFPILDIMRQTPQIPESCQWATFLRNHDELTLEMVTEEERDYMYRLYASEPAARLNLGIRRRLAPLLNGDRKKMELMNALLFSLRGTPVLYYGDEIGMGDNIYLGDRNGVRTPMQWSADRNAGFSRANPQRLILPPITDPEYHYEAVNVETQQANPASFLWWMKRLIALRKNYKAFGRGNIEFLQPDNRKVLAFLRRYQDETILVIANLSHLAQQTQLNLAEFTGCRIIDLFGPAEFAPIKDDRYYFTLSPYAFYWFSLQPRSVGPTPLRSLPAEEIASLPVIAMADDELFQKENWASIAVVLQNYIKGRRWFRSKARDIRFSQIQDVVPMHSSNSRTYVVIMSIDYAEGEPETYIVPVSVSSAAEVRKLRGEQPHTVVARLQPEGGSEALLYDAMMDKNFCKFLLLTMGKKHHFKGNAGEIIASSTRVFRKTVDHADVPLEPAPVKVEQTNTSLVYGNRLVLKLFRQLGEGINPELEIGRFLTEKTAFANISPLAGALEYKRPRSEPVSLAVLQSFIDNEGDAWQYTQESLERYFQFIMAQPSIQAPAVPGRHLLALLKEIPALFKEAAGPYLVSAELLGKRTAEMHLALASRTDDPNFTPEPFTFMYQMSIYQSMRGYTTRVLQSLKEKLPDLTGETRAGAQQILDMETSIIERYKSIRQQNISSMRIRCHGDYHLGQVLYTGKDFVIIDFEGEPARPLSERRLKKSPLQDVAGMIRSFHYASHNALLHQIPLMPHPEESRPVLQQWAQYWYTWVAAAFLSSYLEKIQPGKLLPSDPEHLKVLLDAYILEKAIYEVGYELNNRPDWVEVPINGLLRVMETTK